MRNLEKNRFGGVRILTFVLAGLCLTANGQTDFSAYHPDVQDKMILARVVAFLSAWQSEDGFSDPYRSRAELYTLLSLPPTVTRPDDIGRYWGQTVESAPGGFGVAYRENEAIQIGNFKSGKLNGYGIRMKRSTLYVGNFKNGKSYGHGSVYIFRDTTQFTGNAESLMKGHLLDLIEEDKVSATYHGLFTPTEKGQLFEGRIIRGSYDDKDSKRPVQTSTYHGRTENGVSIGSAMIEDGMFEGSKINGSVTYYGPAKNLRPGGVGVVYLIDQTNKSSMRYEGDLTLGNLYDFSGKCQISDGTRLEGKFTGFKCNGTGKISFGNSEYEGEILDGQPTGKGTIVYKNGNKFSGTWDTGRAVSGTFFDASSGESITGEYKEGKLHGTVQVTKDGVTRQVEYVEGERKGQ